MSDEIHQNKIDFKLLQMRRYKNRLLQDNKVKTVRGFDTETLHGYAHLICDDTGRHKDIRDIYDTLSFLCSAQYRDTVNFWYNIQFDFDAVCKYLDLEQLQELVCTCQVKIGEYKIKYIPNKMFSIKLKTNSYRFYDVAQFYEMKLSTAAALYCSGAKNPDKLDVVKIGADPDYWQDHYSKIVKYCIQDCRLTAELGEKLQADLIETTGHSPKTYISQAGLSKDYFRRRCDIPDIQDVPDYALFCAFNAYHGGRFEVTERGAIGEAHCIDINSAYPAHIAELIDISAGKWERVDRLSESAYYGFYLAKVDLPYMHLPPLAMNLFGTVVYPCGQWTGYFTREELLRVGEIGQYEIISGVEFNPYVIRYPFKEAIETLYAKKNATPKSNYQYNLYKKIMNSLYGCFYEKIRQEDGQYKVGLLFNPIYASLITANTRMQIWDEAVRYGKNCVSLATDGLLIRGDHDYPDETILGGWGYDGCGKCTILRSGIYALGDTMKQRCVIKRKKFLTPEGEYSNLFDYIRAFPEQKKYPVLNVRPVHMREAIVHHKDLCKEDINIFQEHTLAFDLNTDVKRIWETRDICGRELLETRITSMPWKFPVGARAEV